MAGALAGADLAAARRDIEATWPGTAILSSPGTVLDGQGGWVEGWNPVGTVSALLHPLQSGEAMAGAALVGQRAFILSCPASSTLGENWRVRYEGVEYRVTGLIAWGPAEIATRAQVALVSSTAA